MMNNILLTSVLLTSSLLLAAAPPAEPVVAPAEPVVPGTPVAPPSPYSLKFRVQGGLGNIDGIENGFCLGANYALPVGPGHLNAELGYEYFAGSNYNVGIPFYNTIGLNDNIAYDQRKHSLSGFTLRLGYQQTLFDDWNWQAGIALNYFTDHSESNTMFGLYGGAGYWSQTIDHNRFSPSFFGGVRWEMNDYGAFEVNLLLVSYKEDTIFPIYGTTSVTQGYGTKSVLAPKLEIGYVFKF